MTDLELILKAQAGDDEARNALLIRHKGFVHLYTMRRCGRDWPEYTGAAFRGMMRAIETFKPEKGANLLTWSTWFMMREVSRERKRDTLIRVPADGKAGRKRQYTRLMQTALKPRMLVEEWVGREDSTGTQSDANEILNSLTPRDRQAVCMWSRGTSYAEIGRMIGVKGERARTIVRDFIAQERKAAGTL